MNTQRISALQAAVHPVAEGMTADMSANVRFCPEMSAPSNQEYKTKPPRRNDTAPRPLSPRQMMAAGLLLRGQSARGVARVLKINERTVRRWKFDPRFDAEVRRQLAGVRPGTAPSRTAFAGAIGPGHDLAKLDLTDKDRLHYDAMRVVAGMSPKYGMVNSREEANRILSGGPLLPANVRECPRPTGQDAKRTHR